MFTRGSIPAAVAIGLMRGLSAPAVRQQPKPGVINGSPSRLKAGTDREALILENGGRSLTQVVTIPLREFGTFPSHDIIILFATGRPGWWRYGCRSSNADRGLVNLAVDIAARQNSGPLEVFLPVRQSFFAKSGYNSARALES